jgi:hypothetical protein
MQPPLLLAAGLLLVTAGLLVCLFWTGATGDDSAVLAVADGVGRGLGLGANVGAAGAGAGAGGGADVVVAGGGAYVVGGATGAALVGAGPGTEETCEL